MNETGRTTATEGKKIKAGAEEKEATKKKEEEGTKKQKGKEKKKRCDYSGEWHRRETMATADRNGE